MRTNRRIYRFLRTKVKSLNAILKIIPTLRRRNKKIVFTNGCFDLMHLGHAKYLEEARQKGDVLIVAVNSDSSVKKIKGDKRPILGQEHRMSMVAALESVDYVVVFNEDTPLNLIKKIKPDILVKGADWREKDIVGASFVKSHAGRVLTVRLVKGLSTTNIIEKIIKTV